MEHQEKLALDRDTDTGKKILETAARLFALQSFRAVSLKEIADAVGIKTASLYYHYANKESLIEAVLARFETLFRRQYERIADISERAASLADLMDGLFSEEFQFLENPELRLGIAAMLREQHSHESAYAFTLARIYERGLQSIQAAFDKLIEKKLIPPSDTKTLASLFVLCVVASNELYMHELSGVETAINIEATRVGLKALMTRALAQGILPQKEA